MQQRKVQLLEVSHASIACKLRTLYNVLRNLLYFRPRYHGCIFILPFQAEKVAWLVIPRPT